MLKNAVFFTLAMAVLGPSQDRFPSGEFKGFTKSQYEHIIERIEEPFVVAFVRGRVILSGYPLKCVLFEIRGPGESERIRAAKTRDNGFFYIDRVPEGTYAFKATLAGFQSIVGTIIVSDKADRKKIVEIEMPLGV